MDQALFVLPILPGQTEAARAFLEELNGSRSQDLAACNRGVGVAKEMWAIQQTPLGDLLVAYIAGEDIGQAFQFLATSQESFDVWLKEQFQKTTGADLSTPPAGPLSEILTDYQA
jgi:hypothetical protein